MAKHDTLPILAQKLPIGTATDKFGLVIDGPDKERTFAELDRFKASDLVMDALFVTWGNKA